MCSLIYCLCTRFFSPSWSSRWFSSGLFFTQHSTIFNNKLLVLKSIMRAAAKRLLFDVRYLSWQIRRALKVVSIFEPLRRYFVFLNWLSFYVRHCNVCIVIWRPIYSIKLERTWLVVQVKGFPICFVSNCSSICWILVMSCCAGWVFSIKNRGFLSRSFTRKLKMCL